MNVPDDRKYTKDHEWALADGGRVRVGITDYAQDALGDIVYVQLPDAGGRVERDGVLGEVESTKSVSEIYAPVTGVVADVNIELNDAPNRLNDDPYGEGWICTIDPSEPSELDSLLSAAQYVELTRE